VLLRGPFRLLTTQSALMLPARAVVEILDGHDKTSPDLLLTVFTGALGGLVGFLARAQPVSNYVALS
jgi:hypothetical protein